MTKEFKAIDRFGAELSFEVIEPDRAIDHEGEMQFRVAFTKAIQMGIYPRDKMREVLKDGGVLTEEDDGKFQKSLRDVGKLEAELLKAQLSEDEESCSKIASKLFEARNRMFELFMIMNNALANSAEGYAEVVKQEVVMAACTRIKGTKQRYWKDYAQYVLERDGESKSTVVDELEKTYEVIMAEKSKQMVQECPESKYLKTVTERILERSVEQAKEADAVMADRVEEVTDGEGEDGNKAGGVSEADSSSSTDASVAEHVATSAEVDGKSTG